MKKRTQRIILINFIAMVAVVVAIPFAVLSWLDDYTLHGKVIEVPNVCGQSLDAGEKVLADKLLGYEIVDYKYQKGAAENEILEQRPVGAAKVKKGRKIQLTLNSGKEPTIALPDVIDNCSLREAVARLRAAGFKLTEHVTIAGEKDWVYELRYNGKALSNGDAVPEGSAITIVVGNGKVDEEEDGPEVDEEFFD
jgi:beta-lactam-binding protein with PASTA domain